MPFDVARPQQFGYDLIVLGGLLLMLVLTAAALWPRRMKRHVQEHAGATEQWSPAGELAYVPPRPITEDEQRTAELRAVESRWHREFDAAETEILRRVDETFERLTTRAERLGHLESSTWQWTREEVAALIGGRR